MKLAFKTFPGIAAPTILNPGLLYRRNQRHAPIKMIEIGLRSIPCDPAFLMLWGNMLNDVAKRGVLNFGQLIGRVGRTGTRFDDLHFEYWPSAGYAMRIASALSVTAINPADDLSFGVESPMQVEGMKWSRR